MADFTPYTTKSGDRWDLIANQAYGNASDYQKIIDANPGVPKTPYIKAGVTILVPVVDRSEDLASGNNLPPWKR